MAIPLLRAVALAAALATVAPLQSAQAARTANDYPTDAIAEYVYACMKANGENRSALLACSCSFDVVSALLTYDRYLEASTFLSLMQMHGENADVFRTSPESKASIKDLRRAQAEGDVRCFLNN